VRISNIYSTRRVFGIRVPTRYGLVFRRVPVDFQVKKTKTDRSDRNPKISRIRRVKSVDLLVRSIVATYRPGTRNTRISPSQHRQESFNERLYRSTRVLHANTRALYVYAYTTRHIHTYTRGRAVSAAIPRPRASVMHSSPLIEPSDIAASIFTV